VQYQDLEDEAMADLAGEALAARLDELAAAKKAALEEALRDLEVKGRESEVQLRT